MLFSHPWVLLLLAIPIALLAWIWRGHARHFALVLPFDHGPPGDGRGWRFLINLAESIPAVILAIAICLFAGPQQLATPQLKRSLTNIQLCIDVSGSMTQPFGDGTAYDAAMQAANEFTDVRNGDAFGLTFFGSQVLHWAPLTPDTSAIRSAAPFMRPEQLPYWFSGTEIKKALHSCRKVLQESEEGDRMIVLVTDGMAADLYGEAGDEMVRELKAANITVFVILIGMHEIPPEMVTITEGTGGEAFYADDPSGLAGVFARIDAMKPARFEKTLPEAIDGFVPWSIAGLVMLGLASLAACGARYTPW